MLTIVFLCLFVIVLYLIWFYILEFQKKKSSPPGPPVFPFVGSVPFMAMAHSKPHLGLVKLAEKYGDLMRVKLGPHEYVVLSSMEVLNDLLSNQESTGRPKHGAYFDRIEIPNTGIIMSEGEPWKARSLWMAKAFRQMGFGRKSYFEESARQMISELHSNLANELLCTGGKVLEVNRKSPLSPAIIMWRLLIGSQTPEDDAECETFMTAIDTWLETGVVGDGLLIIAPFLKHLIPGITGYTAKMELLKVSIEIAQKWYDRFWKLESESPQTFFHSYILEEKKGRPWFFRKDFYMTFSDILMAGVETSDGIFCSLCLFLTLFPEKQEKVAREIATKFPKDHVFSILDLKMLPYTEAFILETHRLAILATNWGPHTLTGDVRYRGFTLKKGTTLLPNPHSAFKCKKLFGNDVEEFRPERFFNPGDNSKLSDLRKLLTPFGIGKRACPGEPIAEILTFLFLVSTISNFKLSSVPGEKPPQMEFDVGGTARPKLFRVFVSRR